MVGLDFRDKWVTGWQLSYTVILNYFRWGFTSVTDHWIAVPHVAPKQEQQSMSSSRKKYLREKLPSLHKGLKIDKTKVLIWTTVFYVLFTLIYLYKSLG